MYKDSITKEINVTSISSCYFKCWDETYGCVAVGFLLDVLNKRNDGYVTCHMIGNKGNGKRINMDVMVSDYIYYNKIG